MSISTWPEMLVRHYERVGQDTRLRRAELETSISSGYLDRMDVGLGHWVASAGV